MSMSVRFNFSDMRHGTSLLKRGFAKMQEGGVIMDVVTPEEAHIAEDAGAVSVMALERVPADIRAQGGVARMSHPDMIKEIIETTSIPVMAKARIGHDDEANRYQQKLLLLDIQGYMLRNLCIHLDQLQDNSHVL